MFFTLFDMLFHGNGLIPTRLRLYFHPTWLNLNGCKPVGFHPYGLSSRKSPWVKPTWLYQIYKLNPWWFFYTGLLFMNEKTYPRKYFSFWWISTTTCVFDINAAYDCSAIALHFLRAFRTVQLTLVRPKLFLVHQNKINRVSISYVL